MRNYTTNKKFICVLPLKKTFNLQGHQEIRSNVHDERKSENQPWQ